jgi:hypothetical protein
VFEHTNDAVEALQCDRLRLGERRIIFREISFLGFQQAYGWSIKFVFCSQPLPDEFRPNAARALARIMLPHCLGSERAGVKNSKQ